MEVTNLFAFEADLEAFADQIDVELRTVIKRIVIALHDRIVERTPVDTGRARASWGIEKDEVGSYEAEEGTSLSGDQAARVAKGQQGKLRQDFDPYVVWWIFNNLPYILKLEYGHSSQAPSGMVRLALAEVEAEIIGILR